jgi:hypothetical protein
MVLIIRYWTKGWMRGHAIAQAVSCWLPTMVARVQAQDLSCGICGGKSGTGAGILRVLHFPVPIFISTVAPQSPSSIIWAGTIAGIGHSTKWTQSHPTKNNKKWKGWMTNELVRDLLQVTWNRRARILLRKWEMLVLNAPKGRLTLGVRSAIMQWTLTLWSYVEGWPHN